MKIEEGKIYKTRAGGVFGPIKKSESSVWPWCCLVDGVDWFHWTEDGRARAGKEDANDLVEEMLRIEDTLAWKQTQEREQHKEYGDAKDDLSASLTKHKLLDLAKDATRDRGLNYGAPEDNFKRIAEHWNAFMRNRGYGAAPLLTPGDVAIMMTLMKLARLEHSPTHLDSWVDVAGYAACGAEIALRPSAVT